MICYVKPRCRRACSYLHVCVCTSAGKQGRNVCVCFLSQHADLCVHEYVITCVCVFTSMSSRVCVCSRVCHHVCVCVHEYVITCFACAGSHLYSSRVIGDGCQLDVLHLDVRGEAAALHRRGPPVRRGHRYELSPPQHLEREREIVLLVVDLILNVIASCTSLFTSS